MLACGLLILIVLAMLGLFLHAWASNGPVAREVKPMATFIYGTRAHNYSVNLCGHCVTVYKRDEDGAYHVYGEGGDPDDTVPKAGEFVLMRLKGGGTGKYRIIKIKYVVDGQKKWGGLIKYEGKL